jgi:hypothetical protein
MKTRVWNQGHFCLSLIFCLSLASCNKDDFYEKEFLDNPFQDPTTTGTVNDGGEQGGSDAGMDGGTQGGVDSGVDGGTNGGTTSGSTSGGTTGGTDGSTTGGTDGSTTGGTDGSTTGGTDGSTTGGTDGSTTGGTDGSTTGGTDGSTTGGTDGSTTGGTDGSTTGGSTGCTNNGHGNNTDGVDSSNPGTGSGGPNGAIDESGDFDDESNPCEGTTAVEEVFHQKAEAKKLDIVWIIDNSGSMSDEQTALGDNFNVFIQDFITQNVDFRMAITTTDATSSYNGLMVPYSAEKLNSAKAKENPEQFMHDFREMVKVGTRGSGYEKGLQASEGFMNRYADTFVREDAYLAVVVLSDEEDQSAKSTTEYANYLKSFKSEAGLVKFYSIVDVGLTNTGSTGITTGYERYAQVSEKTAGVVGDIRDDFYRVLNTLGESIINLLDSFALAEEPVQGSLRVFVNGAETFDYTYDASSHSIKFNQASLPPVGAEIKVTYLK